MVLLYFLVVLCDLFYGMQHSYEKKVLTSSPSNKKISTTFFFFARQTQVGFSYPTRPDDKVLDSVSISVAPGESLALVGPSGGGKSTVTKASKLLYR